MSITGGTYKARAAGECVLGESKKKGTPFIEFYFKIAEGENNGGLVRWTGYFAENTNERSIAALQLCGWIGDDLSEFADGKLHGLDRNEVSIVVDLEEYTNNQGEKRHSPRVLWVNKPGGPLNVEAKMNEGAAAAFGSRMRGLVHKMKEKSPHPAAKPTPSNTSRGESEAESDPSPF